MFVGTCDKLNNSVHVISIQQIRDKSVGCSFPKRTPDHAGQNERISSVCEREREIDKAWDSRGSALRGVGRGGYKALNSHPLPSPNCLSYALMQPLNFPSGKPRAQTTRWGWGGDFSSGPV